MKTLITDEMLNAFVDQQLTQAEMVEMSEAIAQDPELARRSCEIRQIKSQVRYAYENIEPSRPARPRNVRAWGMQAAAAALLLALGGAAGWSLRPASAAILPEALAQSAQSIRHGQQVAAEDHRYILHLDSDRPESMAAVLDYADQILDNAKNAGVEARLEIVANSYGLNLLRTGHSPHVDRIDTLARKYPNLSFVACGQTVARFRKDGQTVSLIEQARVAPSAIGEVVGKMKEGWTYIRV